jgi:hypothetical protein
MRHVVRQKRIPRKRRLRDQRRRVGPAERLF